MLAVLLPGMLAIIGVELWLTRADAIEAANAAFDRSLHGAIKSVDLNVSTASGGLAVELPYPPVRVLPAHGTRQRLLSRRNSRWPCRDRKPRPAAARTGAAESAFRCSTTPSTSASRCG